MLSCEPDGRALLRQKNKCAEGDELELLAPGRDAVPFRLGALQSETGEAIPAAPHPMMLFKTALPMYAPPLSILRKKTK